MKFYRCKHCGKIVALVKEVPVPTICCGEKMEELIPNTEDGAHEKHIPVVSVENGVATVKVGEVTAATDLVAKKLIPQITSWGLVGVNGDWNTDIVMTKGADGKYTCEFTATDACEVKARANGSWDVATSKGDNVAVAAAGNYRAVLDANWNLTIVPAN